MDHNDKSTHLQYQ